MLPVGALTQFVLLPGAFWAHDAFKMATLGPSLLLCRNSVSELRRACFRQARAAQRELPPSALFRARAFALPPCAPKSHMRPLPHFWVYFGSWPEFASSHFQFARASSFFRSQWVLLRIRTATNYIQTAAIKTLPEQKRSTKLLIIVKLMIQKKNCDNPHAPN